MPWLIGGGIVIVLTIGAAYAFMRHWANTEREQLDDLARYPPVSEAWQDEQFRKEGAVGWDGPNWQLDASRKEGRRRLELMRKRER